MMMMLSKSLGTRNAVTAAALFFQLKCTIVRSKQQEVQSDARSTCGCKLMPDGITTNHKAYKIIFLYPFLIKSAWLKQNCGTT